MNGNAVAFFGRSREDLFASERGSFGPPIQPDGRPTKEIAWDLLRRAAAGEVVTEEVLFYNARRELVPCDVRMVRLPSPDRVLIRLAVTDISLRKQTEEALRESEERLRTIFETAHVAIATVTVDGCFITGNPAFQELL